MRPPSMPNRFRSRTQKAERKYRKQLETIGHEPMFSLSKRCYKIFALTGIVWKIMFRNLTALDTGAGSSFITRDTHPPPGGGRLTEEDPVSSVPDTGIVKLTVRLGQKIQTGRFIVCKRLVTSIMFWKQLQRC